MDRDISNGEGAPWSAQYAHLIGASCGDQAVATCLYFDELRSEIDVRELIELAEHWFTQSGSRPRVLLLRDKSDSPRKHPTVKTLRASASGRKASEVMTRLEAFPKGRASVEDTWLPSVYFAVSMEQPTAVFMSVNSAIEPSAALDKLKHGDSVLGSGASYAFWFPVRYSPLAYFWALSFQPNGRTDGRWGDRERRRLTNWRDNTRTDTQGDADHRLHSARDGYVRDAYPMMLLGASHMARQVGTVPLQKAIKEQRLGSVEPLGEKYLWSIPRERLAEAQRLLDDHNVSLAGRVHHPSSTMLE